MIYEEILCYHYKDFKESYENKKAKGESITIHVVKNENSKIHENRSSEDDYDSEN